jgi:anti-sigma factor RsiW
MTCTAWRNNLTERLYGEITDDDDLALTAHLESCSGCRDTLAEFQRVRTAMRADEQEMPRVPRVVVLRGRPRLRPALLAASLLGAAILAGLGAGAGYALGLGHAPSPAAASPSVTATAAVSTEELVRREVDRRLAALQESRIAASEPNSGGTVATAATQRPVNASELRSEFAKFERRLNGARAADLDYVLDQIAASEYRIGTRLGKTNDALRTVALANTPYVNEQ